MMKTSKLVGWSQHQPSQSNAEPWTTTPAYSPPSVPTTLTTFSTAAKDPPTNTSLDSGVAGLRDTPVHTPAPLHKNNNNSNMPGPKAPSTNDDYDVPKFIVDQTTRTTYMKGRFLGKGGFARVHELTDLTTNVTYAGKIIPKSRITKPHHKEKIAREIEVHRQLHHQHVVRFHRYFEDDSNVYIILENCSMRSLVHIVKYRRTLTEPEVRYYIRQLAEGVAYIHGEGIIHRDLKLGNMFLSHDMQVKIGDFGLATRTSDSRQVTICGTPNYIAPEVLNKYGHYYQADIWAIGCIMYALLVGQPPFETETLKETYSRITSNQYVIPPLVSPPGRALITDLLHPEPKSRPTVDELLQHDFFTKGFIPRILPTTACTQVPKLGIDGISKSASMPEQPNQQQHQQFSQVTSQDIKKITTSVSTLRLPNIKPQQDKIRDAALRLRDTKDCNVGINGLRLFEKLTSAIYTTDSKNTNCLGGMVAGKKKDVTSGTLYNLLAACLDSMPDGVGSNPTPLSYSPLFITKWIDYSNKYGFGYQLSDQSVGVFFNDLTRISISHDKSRVEFHDNNGRLSIVSPSTLPAWLQERYHLLRYVASYMDENLSEAGETTNVTTTSSGNTSNSSNNSSTSSTSSSGDGSNNNSNGNNKANSSSGGSSNSQTVPHVRRWDRTPKSIIMQLSNGTFQINFFKDHTKIIVSGERSSEEACLLYINSDRVSSTFKLSHVASSGCDGAIRERLVYALSCLRQYAELDGEEV